MAATSNAADVFVNPSGLFDRLVFFTDTDIVSANPEAAALARLGPASAPADLNAAAGADASHIPYSAIKKVSTNLHGDSVNVRWRDATRDRLTSLSMKDAAVRDDAWGRLRRRLGRDFTFTDVQFGVVRAALAPLATIAVSVLITWMFYMAAAEMAAGAEAEIRGRNAMIKRIAVFVLDLIGPTGVLIVGALITAMAAMWAVARVRKPPRMLTLTRR